MIGKEKERVFLEKGLGDRVRGGTGGVCGLGYGV
jgi:hypothetical protein